MGSQDMITKSIFLVIAIVSTLSVVGFTVLTSSAFAIPATDRCVSERGLDTEGFPLLSSQCADKSLEGSKEIIKDEKQLCKDGDNKCSGSQTGFGQFGNWLKKGEVELK